MKVELKFNSKKYQLETKSVSGLIKSKVKELDLSKQSKIMDMLQKLDKIQLTTIAIDELFTLMNYQKEYGANAMPESVMKEIKPIYKKMSDELNESLLDWYMVELNKILLDSSKISEDVKELFEGSYDNEFWQEQSEEELYKVIDFFRRRRV